MPKKTYRVAVVGATGAVGVEMLRLLVDRRFPYLEVHAFASERSMGKSVPFGTRNLQVAQLTPSAAQNIDIALFSAGASISREFAPFFVKAGALVIDNSSAFRMELDVPLVIPEVNSDALNHSVRLVAVPNCSTIIAVTPLWPIHQKNPIRRLIAATYQAASGAGAAAMSELVESTRAELNGKSYKNTVFPHPYAFNLFSHNSKVDPATGYNGEELKMADETRKIFNDRAIRISATCVRVPVLRAHSEALHFECERPISPQEVSQILKTARGVRLVDDPHKNHYPMPKEASGQNDILVGRIRQDVSDPSGRSIALFVSGDQLLKGAALNAVQIAEVMIEKGYV